MSTRKMSRRSRTSSFIKFPSSHHSINSRKSFTKDILDITSIKNENSETSSNPDLTNDSTTEKIIRKFKQKFIIFHYSPFKAVWDWVVLLLVVYTAVFTPFTVAFLLNEDEKRASLNKHASTRLFQKQQIGADPFVILDLIVDLMFMIDIFISFRTTYVNKEGEAIYDPMVIAKNYLKGWFVIDAIAAMPYDLIFFGSGNIDTIKITGLLKTMRLLRLIRIGPKLQKFSEYGLAMLLLLLSAFALVGHWLACLFYGIAYMERPTLQDPKYSWLDHLAEKYNMPFHENDSLSGPDLASKYITAFFFTMTSLTSVGFGNVSPSTNYEKIFSIVAMLLGSLISAAIFGNVTTIMMKMYEGTEELKEMQENVKEFIKFHTIPKVLSKRMHESFEHTWSYTNGIDMNKVLKSFPESLQADICLHLNRQLLSKCPAFEDASEGCLKMLALQFKSTHTPPGDTLIHKGDNLTAIYFIARGTLEIVANDEVLAILDKNDIFGENIGKYQEKDLMGRSSCDVRALTYCDLHKIERADLLNVLDIYPDYAECFEKKFQVTFDLRECEMSNLKSNGKRKNRFSKALLSKHSQGSGIGVVSAEHKNSQQGTPIFTRRLNRLSLTDSDTQVLGNPQLQRQPSNLNIDVTPGKKLVAPNSFMWKKSNNLLKNLRSMPKTNDRGIGSSFAGCKRQISNLNDVENELDTLLNRVNKMEESIKAQMDELLKFVSFNCTDDSKITEESSLNQSRRSHKDLVHFLAAQT